MRKDVLRRAIAVAVIFGAASLGGLAQESRPAADSKEADIWSASAEAKASFLAGADIDDAAGDVETVIAETNIRVRGTPWLGGFVNFGAGYEYRHYAFDGAQSFVPAVSDPWEDVHTATVGAQILQGLSREWGVFLGASMKASAADDADLGDGVSGIFLAGVGYDFGGGFRAGVGAVGLAAFEDDFRIYPAVQFDWQIDEEWNARLEGLRFDLTYRPDPAWVFGLGAEFDGVRFRLPDDAALPEGIVNDRRFSVFLHAGWKPIESLEITLETGVDLWRRFRIEDRNGDNGDSHETDPAPYIGLGLIWRF